MRVLISGGGTGGHLTPGIALYEECKQRGMECRYVLRDVDMRYTMCERIDVNDRILVHIQGMSRKISLRTIIHIFKLISAFFQIFRSIRHFRPDFILITGGYVSNPVAFASLLLRCPLYMTEQNSVAGTTNRFYSRYSKRVFTTFPDALKLRTTAITHTGNPTIFSPQAAIGESRKFFGVEKFSKVVGISGGSQGAQVINNCIMSLLDKFKKEKIAVIWSLGAVEYQRLVDSGSVAQIEKDYPNVKAYRFIEKMEHFFTASDLVISRAGASTISELILFKKPSLLIPILNSPDDHQKLNALYLVKNKASLMLEEPQLNQETMWLNVLSILDTAQNFSTALESLQMPRPAQKIIETILSELS